MVSVWRDRSSTRSALQTLLRAVWERNSSSCQVCPPGWRLYGGSCYRVGSGAVGWAQAEGRCRDSGAQLVVINDAQEQEFLTSLAPPHETWIGLHDRSTEGSFQWGGRQRPQLPVRGGGDGGPSIPPRTPPRPSFPPRTPPRPPFPPPRGNSKYHYYGLRIKASSPLLRLMEDQQHLAMRQQPFSQKQRLKPIQKMEGMTNGVAAGQQQPAGLSDISTQVQQYQQFLDASRTLPDFPELELHGKALPEGACAEDVRAFQLLYREHCEAIVDVMINLQFTLVETLWKTFWRYSPGQPATARPSQHDEAEKRLPRSRLVALSRFEPVLRWARACDHALYQGLVEILIPDVLRPIPSALTQAIRNFAKSLEGWLTAAMVHVPEEMVRVKLAAAGALAQTLRRYTSLNHLAQAARAVLQNSAQISQMLSDLNRVDFANVQEQASWVCRCEAGVVQRLEQDFKATLQQHNSLEQWALWLDAVVGRVLKPHLGTPAFPRAAKLFLLKWSFYSSMVIRDLTLRSAASFGSFHLIRLLYDEYMYYLVEQRVARARGQSPIAVMGEFANLSSLSAMDPDKDEEEEEEEESDEELPQELSLGGGGNGGGAEGTPLPPDPLEPPPAKVQRSDPRGLFVQPLPSS
eukprot:XP_025001482.1 LOW QUALITY PROTEIN: MHC class II regulatory factor RFX1 [Gallus gallus]